MKTYTPQQEKYTNPFDQIKNNLNVVNNLAINLSNYVNNICKVFGNNCILAGLQPTISFDSSEISIELTPGRLIQDSVLCVIDETITLTEEVGDTSTLTGQIVVYTDFEFSFDTDNNRPLPYDSILLYQELLDQKDFNPIIIKSSVIDETLIWDHDRNKTVLCLIDFTKSDPNTITSALLAKQNSIIFDSQEYIIRGTINYRFDGGWI